MHFNGGKNGNGVWQRIANEIPPHTRRIIPFGGHCAVTRNLKPCAEAFLVEADAHTVEWWHKSPQPGLRIIHGDALTLLPIFKQMGLLENTDTFLYADPPYVLSTRKASEPLYRHELSDKQHAELLAIITRLNCRVAISGYANPLYDETLRDWRRIQFTAPTRRGPATETLWMNYAAPRELHDDRWLDFGNGWRERDRINQKIKRLKRKLKELPELERRRLVSAVLAEIDDAPVTVSAEHESAHKRC